MMQNEKNNNNVGIGVHKSINLIDRINWLKDVK